MLYDSRKWKQNNFVSFFCDVCDEENEKVKDIFELMKQKNEK
jgi:hypothetical protein